MGIHAHYHQDGLGATRPCLKLASGTNPRRPEGSNPWFRCRAPGRKPPAPRRNCGIASTGRRSTKTRTPASLVVRSPARGSVAGSRELKDDAFCQIKAIIFFGISQMRD